MIHRKSTTVMFCFCIWDIGTKTLLCNNFLSCVQREHKLELYLVVSPTSVLLPKFLSLIT